MGFTGGYYTGGGNSAGTVMAILLLLAVVLTVLAFIFIVPENRREKLNAFGKFLHDTCNFNYLLIEKILQALYIFLTVFAILMGLYTLVHNFWVGLALTIIMPIAIRLIYEFLMMAVLLLKHVIMIDNKLKNQNTAESKGKGSEPEFVNAMNKKAQALGMKNTHFVDCCGLTDSDDHYTTAYDIALMSRELIRKYPEILNYSSVWMDTITHNTRQGSKEFGLSNTNRLIRTYEGCVGLKTGSTSKAKFCVSAVAKRKGITLIAVVMAAPDSRTRVKDASMLFDYGFAKCSLYTDENPGKLPDLKVIKGIKEKTTLTFGKTFRCLSTDGTTFDKIKKKLILPNEVKAPVKKGQKAGELVYYQENRELGRIPVIYAENVKKAGYLDRLKQTAEEFCL